MFLPTRTRIASVSLIAILGLASACSTPRVDASSDKTLTESLARVRQSVPASDRFRFDLAVNELMMAQLAAQGAALFADTASLTPARLRDRGLGAAVDGLTAREILAKGDSIQRHREAEERRLALAEIADLEARKAGRDDAAAKLAGFKVIRARYRTVPGYFGTPELRVDLTVKNETTFAISRAYFHGVLRSPGRAVPWLSEEFNYQVPGGLEPGEEGTWNLAPNQYGPWGGKFPVDALLSVEVVGLNGPNGEEIARRDRWDADDEQRLASLRARFPATATR